MEAQKLSVREIETPDIMPLCDYWFKADPNFLKGMGVDLDKMISREKLEELLKEQIKTPYSKKKSYAIIWTIDKTAVGHCNLGEIEFGKKAFMHLHMWKSNHRMKGLGTEFVKRSLPFFFSRIELQEIFCQPHALNLAPNKTLEKLGFEFVKEYVTVPGYINFEQPVKLWRMSREQYSEKF